MNNAVYLRQHTLLQVSLTLWSSSLHGTPPFLGCLSTSLSLSRVFVSPQVPEHCPHSAQAAYAQSHCHSYFFFCSASTSLISPSSFVSSAMGSASNLARASQIAFTSPSGLSLHCNPDLPPISACSKIALICTSCSFSADTPVFTCRSLSTMLCLD